VRAHLPVVALLALPAMVVGVAVARPEMFGTLTDGAWKHRLQDEFGVAKRA